MAGWVRLLTSPQLEPWQVRSYVERRSQPPSTCGARSEGRLTPRPHSALLYSAPCSPHHWIVRPSMETRDQSSTETSDRPSPYRTKPTCDRLSPSPHREETPPRAGGVFTTLYQPKTPRRHSSSPDSRLGSCSPSSLTTPERLRTITEDPKVPPRHFQSPSPSPVVPLRMFDRGSQGRRSCSPSLLADKRGAERYFDNLVAMLQESARGLEL